MELKEEIVYDRSKTKCLGCEKIVAFGNAYFCENLCEERYLKLWKKRDNWLK